MNDGKNPTCKKGTHRWTLDRGRRCGSCGTRRTRMPGTPKLVRLGYVREEGVYCELCKRPLKEDDLVSWWKVPHRNGGTRRTVYCADCHHANVRQGKPLR